MRGMGQFLMFALVIGFIIEFFWWIVGALVLVVLFFAVRSIVRQADAAEEAHMQYCAALAARAEEQHRWVLEGDDRGVYGQYPVPDIVKGELHQ